MTDVGRTHETDRQFGAIMLSDHRQGWNLAHGAERCAVRFGASLTPWNAGGASLGSINFAMILAVSPSSCAAH
jgi:hypothetical protein